MAQREAPEQTYRPSCKVRLVVRFEEWGAEDAPDPPAKPPQLRKGQEDKPLEYQRDGSRFLLLPKGQTVQQPGGPQGQLDAPDDRTHVVEGIVPRTASIKRNGVREADTATVAIALADFPFDPRAVRACAVELYVGTLSAEEFRLGAEGVARGDRSAGADNPRENIAVVADTFLDPYGEQRSNKRFSGWVDEWSADFDEEGEPVVNLECVDNLKLLADQDAPPKLALDPKLPLDEAVASYLSNFPQMAGLEVEMRGGDAAPAVESALARTSFKPRLGPSKDGSSKLSVLDYLGDVAASLGLVLRVEGLAVVLQYPRTLYAQGAVRPGDPFVGRRLPSGRVLQNRTLVWGINLLKMSFKRRFGRSAQSNVEVRCYSPKQKRTLVVRHPSKDQQQKKPLPGGATDQSWKVIEVAGVESEAVLRKIAQGAYELSGRAEMVVTVETTALGSWGGGNDDPDLLDVEAGDPVDVETTKGDFAEDPGEGWGGDLVAQSEGARAAAYLKRLGYSPALADAYARAVSSEAFPVTFRVRTWSIDWDWEEGVRVSGELMNYVEVRADASLPEGEEPALAPAAGASPRRVVVGDV